MIDINTEKARYEELINLEGLDRSLQEDIKRFASMGDQEGVGIAQEARHAVQNRMLYLTMNN